MDHANGQRGFLALEDGTVFPGSLWGSNGTASGEVVFTTGMTGFEEVLTDPSYCSQIVTMTAPHIGNTGINSIDRESRDGKPQVAGFVMRELSHTPSNWRSQQSLNQYLVMRGIVAISDVDSRLLTQHIRVHGTQNGCIGSADPDILVDRARAAPKTQGLDLVARVTPQEPYAFVGTNSVSHAEPLHVVVLDMGVKQNILRCLTDVGCRVTGVPATTTAEQILALAPDGILLSNGPGDPAALDYVAATIRSLLGAKPIFGICLGHQLLARALGAQTYKLPFGHRGLNQPVRDLDTGRVEITTQNHGFVVDDDSLGSEARTTHIHLNDGTSEGLCVADAQAFSVQYHPEAAAGPHDTLHLFERFTRACRRAR